MKGGGMQPKTAVSIFLSFLLVTPPVRGMAAEIGDNDPHAILDAAVDSSFEVSHLAVLSALSAGLEGQEDAGSSNGQMAVESEGASESGASGGVQLMVAGAAVALVGILFKFGDSEGSFDENNNVTIEEKGYSSANYALMAIGGGMFLGGLVIESGRSSTGAGVENVQESNALSSSFIRPSVSIRVEF